MKPNRLLLVLLLGFACGDGKTLPLVTLGDVRAECNPLGNSSNCALPLPSSIYQRDDATTATKVRLDLAAGSLPTNSDSIPLDPAYLNRRDGFSANAAILTAFPGGVDVAGLPPVNRPQASLDPASTTVIVDVATKERVPHFAEVDVAADATPDKQALILRPLVRLAPGHRYAVGIRNTLKSKGGGALPMPAGFRAIVDGTPTKHARLERVRAGFPAVFDALAAVGVAKADLVVAWDFTTASDESIRADLLGGRDAALAAMGEAGANLTFHVDSDVPNDDPVTARKIDGTYDVPLLLTHDGGNDSVLARDADGKPKVVGTYTAPFVAVVPTCAAAQKPVPVVIYGHGLMGSHREAAGGYPRKAAEHLCAIFLATDWRGMSDRDVGTVGLALNDGNHLPEVMEKLVQGIVNFIALEQIARGPMASSPTFAGLIDPSRVYYYGISQGGIFGGTLMAYDPFITRGVLGVPAVNYSVILERSADWPMYALIQHGAYPDRLDDQIMLVIMQMGWDLTDPVTTTAGLLGKHGAPIPGTPPKQILIQMAVADAQVSNLGTEYEGRLAGFDVLGPAPYTPYGLVVKDGPLESAITIWDEHPTPVPPLTNSPTDGDNGTHGSVRKQRAVNEQIKTFLSSGVITQTCQQAGAPVACSCYLDPNICGPEL